MAVDLSFLSPIVGAGMGMALSGWNDERQKRQQERLQSLQIQGQKEMTDYTYAKQLQMWKDTNYPEQVKQLIKAGLNPGLMYGMSGGGGATTGSSSGNVTGAQAPTGGGEIQQGLGMGLQLMSQQAQIDLIKAQTNKTNVEATKLSGVDTAKTQMETEKLFQEWQNLRQTHTLQELETTLRNIENFEKQASQGNRLRYIQYQTETALHNLKIVQNENQISDATIQDQIKTIKQEAIYAVLKNEYTKVQTQKGKSDIQVNDATMRKWSQELMMGWDKMSQTNRDIMLRELGLQGGNQEGIGDAVDKILKITF